MPQPIPAHETRSPEALRRQYDLERAWARRLFHASHEERRRLYSEAYDDFLRQIRQDVSVEASGVDQSPLAVLLQEALLAPFLTPTTVFLEFGAGDGSLARRLAGSVARYVVVEASAGPTDPRALPENVEWIPWGDLRGPLSGASADLAYSCHFVEHLHPQDARDHLRELHRVLRPGGHLICITPNRLLGPHDVSRHFVEWADGLHLKEYSYTELADLLEDAGFERIRAIRRSGRRSLAWRLGPIRWVERFLERLAPAVRRRLLAPPWRLPPFRWLEQVVLLAERPDSAAHTGSAGRRGKAGGSRTTLVRLSADPVVAAPSWQVEPFVHVERDHLYNPLTDRYLRPGETGYEEIRRLALGKRPVDRSDQHPAGMPPDLADDGWLIRPQAELARRHRLQFVSLETTTVCNQTCSFCPVSLDSRPPHQMSVELFERIVLQLVQFRSTLQAIFLHNYNEPTADPRFIERLRFLKHHGLPAACNTNGTGLTPRRVEALVEMGGLRLLSVNLSTLDRERYRQQREADHLELVLRNLEFARDRPLAEQMDLVVLGHGDRLHRHDFKQIRRHFAGSRFVVKFMLLHDRAGALAEGLMPSRPHLRLRGCDNLGSRPLQHLHVTATGSCVLCCQDYHEEFVVGDLSRQSVAEVLAGSKFERLRLWNYGIEEAPAGFLCRRCSFARSEA